MSRKQSGNDIGHTIHKLYCMRSHLVRIPVSHTIYELYCTRTHLVQIPACVCLISSQKNRLRDKMRSYNSAG